MIEGETMNQKLNIDNTYLTLPSILYSKMEPKKDHTNTMDILNTKLAQEIGISPLFLESPEGIQFLSGGTSLSGGPFAEAYCGHQYGHFTMLGDGRAMIIGEQVYNNKRIDLHLKGSGRTPYSRGGDGKATLKSMLREYLISEAMHHLKVPTSRSLAVLKTNEFIQREQMNQGAILVRTATSHIRVGTFEYARALQQPRVLEELADYTIVRHFPQLTNHDDKYLEFFKAVIDNQAQLIAKWQSIGFVHGVLNTDNVLVSGETIDYGPCAFLDHYDPSITFSSIDRNSRYSYKNQPVITSWNLSKLASALLPLIDSDEKTAISKLNQELTVFETKYNEYYMKEMAKKLGIQNPKSDDLELVNELLSLMEVHQLDFTNTFYVLTTQQYDALSIPLVQRTLWLERWQNRIVEDGTMEDAIRIMKQSNPVVIPRNHLVDEALIQASFEHDAQLFYTLLELYQDPFNYDKELLEIYRTPQKSDKRFVTYCGT